MQRQIPQAHTTYKEMHHTSTNAKTKKKKCYFIRPVILLFLKTGLSLAM